MQDQLYDIHGLDTIPWWPPAHGWWILAGLLIVVLAAGVLLLRHYLRYPPGSWRHEAQHALRELRRQRNRKTPKEIATRLSELLRRIAIASHGRKRVAALTDANWLEWLEHSDPNGFAWRDRGAVLLSLPYAPEGTASATAELDELITAALHMTAKNRGHAARTGETGV